MPIPLIAIAKALAAGGTLVPHAGGGMIVTSGAGYIAGTYLSTSAIAGLVGTATATLGAGAVFVSGAASSIIGSAGIFGTTVGATGVTGWLMSAGIISSTPIWIPVAAGGLATGAAAGAGFGVYRWARLRKKLAGCEHDEEAEFAEGEARLVELLIRRLAKTEDDEDGA